MFFEYKASIICSQLRIVFCELDRFSGHAQGIMPSTTGVSVEFKQARGTSLTCTLIEQRHRNLL